MLNPNIPLRDQATARALSVGSSLVQAVPFIRDRIGGADSAAYTPLRWRYNDMAVSEVENWAEVSGNPSHGNTPAEYRETAILAVDKQEIADLDEFARPCRPAVAYALGEAVMIGVFPKGHDFGHTDNEALVGMRIGKGLLKANVGIWRPVTKSYLPSRSVRVVDRVYTDEVPASVPLV